MKRIAFCIFSLFIFISALSGHHISTFRLDHISVSDGLPNSSVSGIVQDEMGFMWFGTKAGLTRYDGYSYKSYYNDPFDDNSLPHNLVQTMYMDENNILWLGTYDGLSRFDLKTETFTNFTTIEGDITSLSNKVVVAIERDSNGRLWVGTLNGLNLFNEEDGTFQRFANVEDDPFTLPENTVRTIRNDRNGNLWIGTYGGLSRWDDEEELFINYACSEDEVKSEILKYKKELDEDDPRLAESDDYFSSLLGLDIDENTIPSNYVMNIQQHPYDDGLIVVGTWEGQSSPGGVALFNTLTGAVTRLETPNKRVYSLIADSNNNLWVGTWGGGLSIVNLEDSNADTFSQANGDELSHDIIYSLFQDLSGVVWIGTNGSGINKYVDWKNRYDFLTNDPDNPFSLPPGQVIAIQEDIDGKIWFGVQGKGVSLFNPESQLVRTYTFNESDNRSLSNPIVNSLLLDSKGNFWVGTNDGLNLYNRDSDDFDRFYTSENESFLPDNLVFSMAEDDFGNLWLGTYTNGITVRTANTGVYRYYENDSDDPGSISDNLIRDLFVDSKGTVWACTNNGLNKYMPETDSFKRYIHDKNDRSSISSDDVRKVFEDSAGDLWVATNGGGVNLYNRTDDNFSYFTTNEGLLNNFVLGIEEDSIGRILFITLSGISVYNKAEQSFSIIDEKTGLLSNELSQGYLKASDGSLYIGGFGGVTHIPFIEDQRIDYRPRVNINEFSVLGIPYDNGDKAVWAIDKVQLDFNQNTLAFEFALSDYSTEGQNQFAYKMEGVDSEWVYSGVRNFARYTNLDPGSYTFKVIGADSRNNWNLIGTSMDITILPPFWGSTFAFVSYVVLTFLFILLVIFRIKAKQDETVRRMEEQKALNIELENRVRKRTAQIEEAKREAEDATKAKSLFLANMSHELRTPLNAVVGFSELLNEDDYSPEKSHIITSIKTAGKTLSTLINDLLDLSKLEAGKMKIKTAPVDMSRVLFEIRHIFKLRLSEKDISFILNIDPEIPREMMIDETRFRQILINLTGNAIKFTDKGHIKISTKLIERKTSTVDLELSISDTGCGIDDREKERIFDLFWQSESRDLTKTAGTGLGLSISKNLVALMNGTMDVESEVGKGTTIRIVFRDMGIASLNREKSGTEEQGSGKTTFEGVKALIADDIADNRNLLLEIMKQMDIQGLPAENGKEALELVNSENPDIIFMDLQMPVMDGYTAASLIKKDEKHTRIPIVAVTASLETELFGSNGAKTNFFSDYITKPYSLSSIREVMTRFLGHKASSITDPFAKVISRGKEQIIDDMENLLIKLEEFKNEWKGLKPSGRMSRLENFAVRLREVGKRHNAVILVEYAETMLTDIKVFDLKGIEKELSRFPDILRSIEQ